MKPGKAERWAECAFIALPVLLLLALIAGVDFGAWLRMLE